MALAFPPSAFWDFSVTLYGRPGVAPACLALQERHGLDVNALMFCLWLAESGRGPSTRRHLDEAFSAVAAWHAEIVRNLRAVRKRLKTPAGTADVTLAQALRARIQKIEIDSEHIEQLTLAATPAAAAPARAELGIEVRVAHAAGHIVAYFVHLGAHAAGEDRDALVTILAAGFAHPAPSLRAALDEAFAAAQ